MWLEDPKTALVVATGALVVGATIIIAGIMVLNLVV